jgi:predicted phage tail protein
MTTFKFYGSLAREVGETWKLKVSSLGEGIRAIEVQSKKLFRHLLERDKEGVKYRVLFDDKPCTSEEELKLHFQGDKTVHIIPVVQGAGGGGGEWYYYVAAGVALIALSFFPPLAAVVLPGGTTLAGMVFTLGVALTLGGLAQLISGNNRKLENEADQASSAFNGQVNTARQGLPVPLAYGELMIGSHTVNLIVRNVNA